MGIRPFDILIITLVSIGITIFSVSTVKSSSNSSLFYIEFKGNRFLYEKDKDIDLDFKGDIGLTKVKIEHGIASITYSECRDQVCVDMGEIKNSAHIAACLPNRLILGMDQTDEDIDVISY